MKLICIFYLCLIYAVKADDCDGLCSCNDGIITCWYLNAFPRIDASSSVTDMTLIFSSVVNVPNLSLSYPRLQSVSFRQCRWVTCALVQRMRRERPGIVVTNDQACIPSPTTTTTTSTTTTTTTTTTTATPPSTPVVALTTTMHMQFDSPSTDDEFAGTSTTASPPHTDTGDSGKFFYVYQCAFFL